MSPPESTTEKSENIKRSVAFIQIFKYATVPYKIMLVVGLLSAFISGAAVNGMFLIFREILNSIGPDTSRNQIAG